MGYNRLPIKTLSVILMGSALLVAFMYTNSKMLVIASFSIVSLGIYFDKIENRINYLLFFISWIYVFKFDLSNQSLYSYLVIGFIISCLLYKKFCFNVNVGRIFIVLCTYLIIMSVLNRNIRIMSIANFIANYGIVFTMAILSEYISRLQYRNYFMFYSFGCLSSALVGFVGVHINQMYLFIMNVRRENTEIVNGNLVFRAPGLDIDPNYYALQIVFALSLLIVILYYQKPQLYLLLLIMVASVFGVLSLSKMYILTFVFTILYTSVSYFKKSINNGIKYVGIIGVSLAIFVIMKFDYIYSAYLIRFTGTGTSSMNFTSGRANLWVKYFREMVSNPKTLLVGQGISNFLNGQAAHNVYLSTLYKLGIVGLILLILYFISCFKMIRKTNRSTSHIWILDIRLLPLYVILIANISLDSSVFSFFPIHILLAIYALNYPGGNSNNIQILKSDNIGG